MHPAVEFLEEQVFRNTYLTNRLNHKDAYNNIKNCYCGPMTTFEFCPKDCFKCVLFLRSIMNYRKATNPGGFLVHKLREKVTRLKNAAMYEKEAMAANIQPDANVNSQDTFEFLLNQINQEIQNRGLSV